MIHLVHHHNAGHIRFLSKPPHPFRHRFYAVLGVHKHHGTLNRQQCGARLVREHVKAGRVHQIDLDALPLGKRDRVLHRYPAGNFLFVIGGHSGPIGHAPLCRRHLRGMQQRGNQSRLAAVRMPHYSYVADLTSLVRFHGVLLENANPDGTPERG